MAASLRILGIRIPRGGRSRHKTLFLVAVSSSALAAASCSSSGGAVPGAGIRPVDFVATSAQNTIAQRTADVTLGGSISAAGTTVPIAGGGKIDFTTHQSTLSFHAEAQGQQISAQVLSAGGTIYLGFNFGSVSVSSLVPGKQWVSLSLGTGGQSDQLGSTSDPTEQLQMLENRGNTVRPLGQKTIDGTTVSGYAVTPTREAIDQALQKFASASHLSQAQLAQLEQGAARTAPPTIDVWFDNQGLLRRMNIDLAAGGVAHGTVTATFDHYGVPVSVSAPPASETISYSDFLKAAQSTFSNSSA